MSEAQLTLPEASTVDRNDVISHHKTLQQAERGTLPGSGEDQTDRRLETEICCAEKLKAVIETGSENRALFDRFCQVIDNLTQQSWYQGERQPQVQQRCAALYETARHWRIIYFHLYLADDLRAQLAKGRTRDGLHIDDPRHQPSGQDSLEHYLWRELQRHIAEIEPHIPWATPHMHIRFKKATTYILLWRQIYSRLHFGEEAIREKAPTSPEEVEDQLLALGPVIDSSHPLQHARYDRLLRSWDRTILGIEPSQQSRSTAEDLMHSVEKLLDRRNDRRKEDLMDLSARRIDDAYRRRQITMQQRLSLLILLNGTMGEYNFVDD